MATVKKIPKPAKPKTPKPKKPAKLKPKTGVSQRTRPERLALSGTYLSSQKTSPEGAQVATEATDLSAKRTTLVTKEQEYGDIQATLLAKGKEVVEADADHDTAIQTYADKAAKVAGGDPSVLKGLGVDAAATARTAYTGPAATVTDVFILDGPTTGSSYVRWTRPPGAAAFLVRWRLDTPPGAPASPYLPNDSGVATKTVEWLVTGLPAGAAFRAQVCAIGAQVGAWSDEVLGKAH